MNQKIAFNERTPSFLSGLLWAAHLIEGPSELARGLYDKAQQDAQEQGYDLSMQPMFFGMMAGQGILLAQAAEVAMKTVLQQMGVQFELTHDLGGLFEALPDEVREYAEGQYKPQSTERMNASAL